MLYLVVPVFFFLSLIQNGFIQYFILVISSALRFRMHLFRLMWVHTNTSPSWLRPWVRIIVFRSFAMLGTSRWPLIIIEYFFFKIVIFILFYFMILLCMMMPRVLTTIDRSQFKRRWFLSSDRVRLGTGLAEGWLVILLWTLIFLLNHSSLVKPDDEVETEANNC